jgi:hypothetical protein
MRMNKKVVVVVVFLVLIISIVSVAVYIQLSAPKVLITYHGENAVPEGLTGFPSPWLNVSTNQPAPKFFYSWNLTMININPVSGIGVPAERALQPLVSKYPQLVTIKITNSEDLTLALDATAFTGNLAKQCFVLYANSQLSGDQISSLTEDLTTYLAPALIEWYS